MSDLYNRLVDAALRAVTDQDGDAIANQSVYDFAHAYLTSALKVLDDLRTVEDGVVDALTDAVANHAHTDGTIPVRLDRDGDVEAAVAALRAFGITFAEAGSGGGADSTMFVEGMDIVETLRAEPDTWEACPVELTVLVNAAADEIERLRTIIDDMADDNSPHAAQMRAQRLAAEWSDE